MYYILKNFNMTITLKSYQITHKNKLKEVLKTSPFAFDLSKMGLGKTYVGLKIASELLEEGKIKHVVIISPATVIAKWLEVAREHGIKITKTMSYQKFSGRQVLDGENGIQIKKIHDYLERTDKLETIKRRSGIEVEVTKTSYKYTKAWEKIVEEGVLLIFDEFQYLKNVSKVSGASKECIKTLVDKCLGGNSPIRPSTNSRVLLLSGTPIDKYEHSVHIFRLLNVMEDTHLVRYNIGRRTKEPAGISEIEKYANSIDQNLKHKYSDYKGNMELSALNKYSYLLFHDILKNFIASSMIPDFTSEHSIRVNNAYYKFADEKQQRALFDAICELDVFLTINMLNGKRGFGMKTKQEISSEITNLAKYMKKIETAKIPLLKSIIEKKLENDTNTKIIIGVNYTSTLEELFAYFNSYNPLVLDGKVDMDERPNVIKKFQEPNTTKRLLIGNIKVMSTGIDLDDKDGNYPRFCLASPNFATMELTQFTHRFVRMDSKNSAEVQFIYGYLNANQKLFNEERLLDCLSKKSQVLSSMVEEQKLQGVIFPGDYPKLYIE